jgi:hypothetical protein
MTTQPLHIAADRPSTLRVARRPGVAAARAGWLFVVTLYLGIFAASLPHGYAALIAVDPTDIPALDISVRSYALAMTLLRVALVAVFSVLALLIAWRRPADPLALGTSAVLIAFGVTQTGALWDLAQGAPELWWLTPIGALAYIPLLTFVLALVPDGRWVRPITLPVAVVLASVATTARIVLAGPEWAGVMVIVAIAWQGLLIGHLAWRLRHHLDRVGRQQVRWLLVAIAGALVAGQLYRVLSLVVTDMTGDITARYAFDLVAIPVVYLAYASVPLALAISMLHHRLYHIDLVVHRTLVYVPVAAVLAGLLAVTVFIAQGAVVAVTGERSELVTAVATLIVVAAFEPVRAGVTALVDRAFLRVRDPAAEVRALDREVSSVLDVLDRSRLASRLLVTVTEAYEPTGAAIVVNDDGPLHRLASTPDWDGSAQVILPLVVDGRRIGTLALGERDRASGYTDRDLDALGDLAATAARALDRARA